MFQVDVQVSKLVELQRQSVFSKLNVVTRHITPINLFLVLQSLTL